MILTYFNPKPYANSNLKKPKHYLFYKMKPVVKLSNFINFYKKALTLKKGPIASKINYLKHNTTHSKSTKKNTTNFKNILFYKKKRLELSKYNNNFNYYYKNLTNIKLTLTGYTHDDLVQSRKVLNNYFKKLSSLLLRLTFIETTSNCSSLVKDLIINPYHKDGLNLKKLTGFSNFLQKQHDTANAKSLYKSHLSFDIPPKVKAYRKNAYALSQHLAYDTLSHFKKVPSHKPVFTTLRSPFVFKKTREQFTLTQLTYNMHLNIKCPSQQQQIITLLKLVKLPCELKIKIIT